MTFKACLCCQHLLLYAVATGVPENGKIMLHDAAKAGLASKEDFKAIVLRKTKKHPDGTAISEENDEVNGLAQPSLVVVQIKGVIQDYCHEDEGRVSNSFV